MKRTRLFLPLLLALVLVAVTSKFSLLTPTPPLDEGEVLASFVRDAPRKLLIVEGFKRPPGSLLGRSEHTVEFLSSEGIVSKEVVRRMLDASEGSLPAALVTEFSTIKRARLTKLYRQDGDFYENLRRDYPGTNALAFFSRPVFSKDGCTAAFYLSMSFGPFGGEGLMVVMTAVDGRWKTAGDVAVWQS